MPINSAFVGRGGKRELAHSQSLNHSHDAQASNSAAPSSSSRKSSFGLFPLTDGKNEPLCSQDGLLGEGFRIVAIHGLNGHAFKTWTHANGHCWLRDSLPRSLPGARIFSFGYDSKVAFSKSFADIDDYARDLLVSLRDVLKQDANQAENNNESSVTPSRIVFVCHSMGGLVVKRALLIAREENTLYGEILDSTTGICFMATPHRGSGATKISETFGAIVNLALSDAKIFSGRFRTDLIRSLAKGEAILKSISASFRTLSQQFKVVSFYELKATFPFSSRIVEPSSALLDIPNEEQVPMNTDHRGICRFDGEFNRYSVIVRNTLVRMVESHSGQTQKRKSYFKVPHPASKTFTGREDYLYWIEEALSKRKDPRIALYGLRGSGKTQTVIRYAELHSADYKAVFFINASSEDDIISDLHKIHNILGLKSKKESEMVERVAEWFTDENNAPFLLVFDNADMLNSTDLSKFIPRSIGHVVITTVDPQIQDCDFVCDAIRMKMMNQKESRQLLRSRLSVQDLTTAESAAVDEITRLLGGLPLALDFAAARVNHQKWTFQTYLEAFQQTPENSAALLHYRPNMSNYDKAVFKAMDINFDTILAQSPQAFSLFVLFAYLDGMTIQFDLLFKGVEPQWRQDMDGELFLQTPEEGCVDEAIVNLIRNRIAFHDAIEKLLSLSVVSSNDADLNNSSQTVAIHPLVQLHVKLRLTQREVEHATLSALSLVAQAYPSFYRLIEYSGAKSSILSSLDEHMKLKFSYLPHARACSSNLQAILRKPAASINLASRYGPRKDLNLLRHAVYLFADTSTQELEHHGQDAGIANWCVKFLELIETILCAEEDEYGRILQLQSHIAHCYRDGAYEEGISKCINFFLKYHPSVMERERGELPISTEPLINADLFLLLVWLAEDFATETGIGAQYHEARRLLGLCCAVNPVAPSTAEKVMLDTKVRIHGKTFKDEGDWQRAAEYLAEYCSTCLFKGTMAEGWATADLAQSLLELGLINDAEQVILKLLESRRNDPKFQSDRPLSETENDHILLRINLAECRLQEGNLEQAEEEFERILSFMRERDVIPHYDKTRIFSVYCGLARVAHKRTTWTKSIEIWEQAIGYGSNISPGGKSWGRTHFYVGVAILSLADSKFESEDFDAAWALHRELEMSGALETRSRMHWMLGLGTYWLEEMEKKWAARFLPFLSAI